MLFFVYIWHQIMSLCAKVGEILDFFIFLPDHTNFGLVGAYFELGFIWTICIYLSYLLLLAIILCCCFRDGLADNPTENPLDENFSIASYVRKARVSYKLKKRKTKNAEEILQHMFEDELNADDLGPDLKDFDELNDVLDLESNTKSRSLTFKDVNAQLWMANGSHSLCR